MLVNLEKRKAQLVSVKLTNKLPESATQLSGSCPPKICLVCVTIVSNVSDILSPLSVSDVQRTEQTIAVLVAINLIAHWAATR